MSLEKYYLILGIDEFSQVPEIKKAYRTKAKLYHPDINKSPDAKEKFIEVNEAYEYLLNIKLGKVYKDNDYKQSYTEAKARNKNWESKERERARQRADYYASQKYKEFRNSKIFKTTELLSSFADYFMIAFAILAPLGAIFGIFSNGLYYFQNGEEKFDYMAVITAFMVFLFGAGVIILYFVFGRKK